MTVDLFEYEFQAQHSRNYLQWLLKSMMEWLNAKNRNKSKLVVHLIVSTWATDSERIWRMSPSRSSGAILKTSFNCAGGNWRSKGNECGRVFWQHFIKPSQIRACFHAYEQISIFSRRKINQSTNLFSYKSLQNIHNKTDHLGIETKRLKNRSHKQNGYWIDINKLLNDDSENIMSIDRTFVKT